MSFIASNFSNSNSNALSGFNPLTEIEDSPSISLSVYYVLFGAFCEHQFSWYWDFGCGSLTGFDMFFIGSSIGWINPTYYHHILTSSLSIPAGSRSICSLRFSRFSFYSTFRFSTKQRGNRKSEYAPCRLLFCDSHSKNDVWLFFPSTACLRSNLLHIKHNSLSWYNWYDILIAPFWELMHLSNPFTPQAALLLAKLWMWNSPISYDLCALIPLSVFILVGNLTLFLQINDCRLFHLVYLAGSVWIQSISNDAKNEDSTASAT